MLAMLEKGEKVFVITRRLFERDRIRQFVGEVLESLDTVIKVRGYAFVHDDFSNEIVRREDVRTRIISLVDAVNIIMVIPKEVILENVQYEIDETNQRMLTDKDSFSMNLNEFGVNK